MIQYILFYRQFGIRRVAQLMSPPLPFLERFDLPKNSLFHYVGEGILDDGPKSDEYLFRNIARPIMLGNITAIGDNKGNPRKLTIPVLPLIRAFHIKNRRYRKLIDVDHIPKDPMMLTVMNYSYIPRLYRYMRSIYSEYYKWFNQQAAVWKNADHIADISDKHQFIVAKLPQRLPSLNELKLANLQMNQRTIKTFNEPESKFILELWKWLGPDRPSSVFSHVKTSHLDKINIVFMESGRFIVLNLGVLNSWRQATKEELFENPEGNVKGFDPLQLQKRFLRLLISLFDTRSSTPEENLGDASEEDTTVTTTTVTPEGTVVDQKAVNTALVSTRVDSNAANHQVLTPEEAQTHHNAKDLGYDTAVDIEEDFIEDKQIDEELEELERIAALSNVDINVDNIPLDEEDNGDDTFSQPDFAKELEAELINIAGTDSKVLEDALMKVCDRYAESGLISAAEYRRYSDLSTSYKTIISPDGKTTLDKFIDIKQEDLKIPENINIPDNKTVFDKTMLKSSLLVFDEHYIKNVLQRDVAAMVMNIQKAGIAVTDYNVNRVQTILGDYDEYTVRINPIEGSSSTIKFKLPAVRDDGTWRSNGSQYLTRKQRGSLPLVKISPTRVALTSYYSKTFVDRSTKKVNDYGTWIRNTISAINLEKEDDSIQDLYQSVEFDNTFMCPKLYSTLAMEFKGFILRPKAYPRTVGRQTYELSFNHRKREALYGKEAISQFEVDGSIIVGKTDHNGLLVLDKNNVFYHVQTNKESNVQNQLIAIGDIESILELDSNRAPVEFAELKVLGRTIPIGLVLGYEMGIEKLIKLLKVEVRRVPVGTRVNLTPYEYAVVFNDETLVFPKDNTFVSMIMAGFNEYHRIIREYNVHDFDDKGVYLNVLETQGLSHRYLREIETMYQLFIDPITRDLLVEMKEPTTFRGLLLRSCELLQYDQHPDELDSAYMRVKGYERFAGAVYTEITKAIRAHAGRPGKARLPIDINPYQIWNAVISDTAVIQISDINPIENLKQQEAMTYSGTGGRTSRTMVRHTRGFHEHDIGVVSESTVDSSDVAVNTYTSANPIFNSVRGTAKRFNRNKDGMTSLVSTSALLSPSATKDD